MKSLYDAAAADEIKHRLQSLTPDSQRLVGKMDAAQMVTYCRYAMEMAVGKQPRSAFPLVAFSTLFSGECTPNDKPLGKNGPTAPELLPGDNHKVDSERDMLIGLIDEFAQGGASACTKEPYCFFGKLTPEERTKGMYKHLDHHFGQFGD